MVQSILVTLLTCCTCWLPIGAIALFFSIQVNQKRDAGDIAGAWQASKNAKMWCWITLGVGLVFFVIAFAFGLLSTVLGAIGSQTG
ncbi:MAG TPA: CD225/dispanin family protein, partial [Longimicrobium sp.]